MSTKATTESVYDRATSKLATSAHREQILTDLLDRVGKANDVPNLRAVLADTLEFLRNDA